MATRKLQEMPVFAADELDAVSFHLPEHVEQRWDTTLQAQAEEGDRVVTIQGVIGFPAWADGTTSKAVGERLKQLGPGDIVVNINSPGGLFFEGQAIHNQLRMHDGNVTVQVIGIAASAASIIAMAGDEILIPKAGWMMIHNTWGLTVGNRHADRKAHDTKSKMDAVSADIYAERTGKTFRAVQTLMDDETFMAGKEAVEAKFADKLLSTDRVKSTGKKQAMSAAAKQSLEQACKAGGMSRSQFRALMALIGPGTPRAADDGKPSAADALSALRSTLDNAKSATIPSAESLFKKD